jgi:hypothetical protein
VRVTFTIEPSTAPILRYSFEGNASNSGRLAGFDGTATRVTYPAGKFGLSGIKFDGTNESRVRVSGSRTVFGNGHKWTISLWFKEDVLIAGNDLWTFRGLAGWESYHGLAGGDRIYSCSAGGCFSFPTPPVGTWHNIVYRYDGVSSTVGAPVEFYVDGRFQGRIANPALLPLISAGVQDIIIGYRFHGSTFYVDEFRVYDQVFTEEEQCELVIGGTWSGNCVLP